MANLFSEKETRNWLAALHKRASHSVVILEDDDKALFLKANYKTHWTFPGGWIDEGEVPSVAAVRELKEETDISVNPKDIRFGWVVVRKSLVADTYQFVFRASLKAEMLDNITLQSSEIDDWRLVSKKEVLANRLDYSKAAVMWANNDQTKYLEQAFGPTKSPNER